MVQSKEIDKLKEIFSRPMVPADAMSTPADRKEEGWKWYIQSEPTIYYGLPICVSAREGENRYEICSILGDRARVNKSVFDKIWDKAVRR